MCSTTAKNIVQSGLFYNVCVCSTVLGSQVDPTIRLVLEEKEQALLALQETVEILQIKVNRLEHLVQLKDMRLEDLTRHLERYKARANVP